MILAASLSTAVAIVGLKMVLDGLVIEETILFSRVVPGEVGSIVHLIEGHLL